MSEITRRGFLRNAAVAGVGMAGLSNVAMASEPTATAEQAPKFTWVDAADLVVVGGGGAGCCAAIEAANQGLSVLILEKAGFLGGDTQISDGMIQAAGTAEEAELGGNATDTPELFAKQQVKYAQGYGDTAMIEEMCLESPNEFAFMRDLGRVYGECSVIAPVWGYDDETSWGPRCHWDHTRSETHPEGHFGTLRSAIGKTDAIRVKTECEVAHLVMQDGQVVGVEDVYGNLYRADRGVVLATESFGSNKEMNRRYNHVYYWALCLNDKYGANTVSAHVPNTGDGIRMAQEIGADLALSTAGVILDTMYFGGVGSGHINTEYAGIDYANEYNSSPLPGKILVNKRGKRFVQEDALWGYVNHEVYEEAMATGWNSADDPIGVWAIQDSANFELDSQSMGFVLRDSPYSELVMGGNAYAELVQSADTIEELAEKIGVPADALVGTVERWNRISTDGVDPDFDRRTDFGTIEVGPFYAMPYIPQTLGPLGGLRTDIETNVLNVNGEPIPRLYAAGTIMSGMWCGPFYSSCGWAILGTVHWGRKAARSIAALDAWTTEPIDAAPAAGPEPYVPAEGSYVAGVYEADGFGRNGLIPVNVEFSDSQILSVTVGENSETLEVGTAALDILPERIVEAQSCDIDVVCGATVTSRGLLLAVDDCISQVSK